MLISTAPELLNTLQSSPVVMHTETVYGICALANQAGCQSLYALKKRDPAKPFVLVVANMQQAAKIVHIPPQAKDLLTHIWPGPLTLIAQSKDSQLSELIQSTTLGVRVPHNPLLLQALQTLEQPLLLTSANISGQLSITRLTQLAPCLKHLPHTSEEACAQGIESTVARWSDTCWTILRAGATSLNTFIEYGHPVSCQYQRPQNPWCVMNAKPAEHDVFLGFGPEHAESQSQAGSKSS